MEHIFVSDVWDANFDLCYEQTKNLIVSHFPLATCMTVNCIIPLELTLRPYIDRTRKHGNTHVSISIICIYSMSVYTFLTLHMKRTIAGYLLKCESGMVEWNILKGGFEADKSFNFHFDRSNFQQVGCLLTVTALRPSRILKFK